MIFVRQLNSAEIVIRALNFVKWTSTHLSGYGVNQALAIPPQYVDNSAG